MFTPDLDTQDDILRRLRCEVTAESHDMTAHHIPGIGTVYTPNKPMPDYGRNFQGLYQWD
jgi:hypothetical protein